MPSNNNNMFTLLFFETFSSDKEQKEPGSAWREKHCPGWRSSNPFPDIRHYVRYTSDTVSESNPLTPRSLHFVDRLALYKDLKGPLLLLTAMPTWCPMIWPELPSSKLFQSCVFAHSLLTWFISALHLAGLFQVRRENCTCIWTIFSSFRNNNDVKIRAATVAAIRNLMIEMQNS